MPRGAGVHLEALVAPRGRSQFGVCVVRSRTSLESRSPGLTVRRRPPCRLGIAGILPGRHGPCHENVMSFGVALRGLSISSRQDDGWS